MREALQKGDGSAVLALLQNGLNPNADVCIDYSPPDFAYRFPFMHIPEEAFPRTCKATSPLVVLAAQMPPASALRVVGDLLRRGVGSGARDTHGVSVLEAAIESGDEKTVALLLKNGADPLAVTSHGTALHFAATQKNLDIVRLILNHGVAVDTPDRHKGTALMTAAHRPSLSIVALLLQHGAKPNAADDHGMTPLQAAFNANWNGGNAPVIRLLLQHGASLFQKNKKNQMPFDSIWLVKQFKHPQSLEEQLNDQPNAPSILPPSPP